MEEKNKFFEDENGNKSSIRLQMFITMFFSFLIIGYQVFYNQVDIVLTTILLTATFAPKQIQNFSEKGKK